MSLELVFALDVLRVERRRISRSFIASTFFAAFASMEKGRFPFFRVYHQCRGRFGRVSIYIPKGSMFGKSESRRAFTYSLGSSRRTKKREWRPVQPGCIVFRSHELFKCNIYGTFSPLEEFDKVYMSRIIHLSSII
jgi:hypothetical protein